MWCLTVNITLGNYGRSTASNSVVIGVLSYCPEVNSLVPALGSLAPPYLSDECQLMPHTSRRLRSSSTFTCAVPWIKTRLCDSCRCRSSGVEHILSSSLRLLGGYTRLRHLLKIQCLIAAAAHSDSLRFSAMYKYSYLGLLMFLLFC